MNIFSGRGGVVVKLLALGERGPEFDLISDFLSYCVHVGIQNVHEHVQMYMNSSINQPSGFFFIIYLFAFHFNILLYTCRSVSTLFYINNTKSMFLLFLATYLLYSFYIGLSVYTGVVWATFDVSISDQIIDTIIYLDHRSITDNVTIIVTNISTQKIR